MYRFYFEKLDVWNNARELVKLIYQVTSTFPDSEKFGITNQIRRASTEITANIAEGFARTSEKEKSRFITIAYSTSIEVINFLILSLDLKFINEDQYTELREKIEVITNQLNALHNTINKN